MTGPLPVLRVLAGPKAGAQALLPPHGRVTVGHEFWHDVVIRDASTRGCAFEIQLGEDGVASLSVLDGSAALLGRSLAAGQTAVLPHFTPVTIGGSALAYGSAESPRWSEAAALASASLPGELAVAAEPSGPAAWWARWRGNAEGGRLNWGTLAGVCAALFVAVAAGPAIDALELGGGPRDNAEERLHDAGYRQVTVADAPNGGVAIAGFVPADADRDRVRALLAAGNIPASVDVRTGAELARAAADVARMNGIEASGTALPGGGVELRSPPLDDATRERVAAVVRRDVPGLTRLTIRDDLPADDGDGTVRTVADATKRVSSVVTGDPAYIITADGARYFPGALMPSGHRLISIQGSSVTLERGGRTTEVQF